MRTEAQIRARLDSAVAIASNLQPPNRDVVAAEISVLRWMLNDPLPPVGVEEEAK